MGLLRCLALGINFSYMLGYALKNWICIQQKEQRHDQAEEVDTTSRPRDDRPGTPGPESLINDQSPDRAGSALGDDPSPRHGWRHGVGGGDGQLAETPELDLTFNDDESVTVRWEP